MKCSGQTELAQGGSELLDGAETHAAGDAHPFAVATVFDELAVDQILGHLPHGFAGGGIGEPTSKVGGQGIEVQIKPIGRKQRNPAGCQGPTQSMHQGIGDAARAWTEGEGGDELGDGIEGDPTPSCLGFIPQSQAQFIELNVTEA